MSQENVRHVLVDEFKNYPKGEIWRGAFRDLLGNGIFNADGLQVSASEERSEIAYARDIYVHTRYVHTQCCQLPTPPLVLTS